jgi:hypothetical protein
MTTKKKHTKKHVPNCDCATCAPPECPHCSQRVTVEILQQRRAEANKYMRVGECRGFAEGLQAAAAAFAEQLRTAPDACRMAKVDGMQWFLIQRYMYKAMDVILELQPAPQQRPDRG